MCFHLRFRQGENPWTFPCSPLLLRRREPQENCTCVGAPLPKHRCPLVCAGALRRQPCFSRLNSTAPSSSSFSAFSSSSGYSHNKQKEKPLTLAIEAVVRDGRIVWSADAVLERVVDLSSTWPPCCFLPPFFVEIYRPPLFSFQSRRFIVFGPHSEPNSGTQVNPIDADGFRRVALAYPAKCRARGCVCLGLLPLCLALNRQPPRPAFFFLVVAPSLDAQFVFGVNGLERERERMRVV